MIGSDDRGAIGRRRRRRIGCVALLGVLCLAGRAGAADAPRRLRVLAATVVEDAVRAAAERFEDSHEGVRVSVESGAAREWVHRIRSGVAGDVFAGESPVELERLARADLILRDTRIALAGNVLVVVVPPNHLPPEILQDVIRPEYELIAVVDPDAAPLGRFTLQSLESLALIESVRVRLVRTPDSKRVLAYLSRGDLAAGFVYRTDARAVSELPVGPEVPAEAHSPIVHEAAVLAAAAEPDLGKEFVSFLASPAEVKARAALGFTDPP